MEKKQSIIDWLVQKLNDNDELEMIEQAKAMHRKEIENAWLDGVANWDSEKEADQYYKEIFEK